MKDPKDKDTIDFVDQAASALKSINGDLQLPVKPESLLKFIAIHCADQSRDPVSLLQDIHDATCYWLHDRDMREMEGNTTQYDYTRGLNS